ncbi:fibronectin type III domain-containing protein [Gryllotalpicola reticulitermitis]|uniref:Fibronectin type III domain-containing protein n=1 Tax=Gryllotalpicola reticulitermitis TaxID=1184153 RepID=A0ABV8QC40_9MICO
MTDHETPADQHFGADPNVPDHEHTRAITRRGFLGGSLAIGAAIAVGGLAEDGLTAQSANAATASTVPSVPLPTTIVPEQLRLAFGANPATEVTVSFSAPGTVPLPAPTLAYSKHPITRENRGTIVKLPKPTPLNAKSVRTGPAATSFTDGTSGFTTYNYHVPLKDLEPGTSYYYEVSNGAEQASVAGASFTTAREGRFPYRFTSFGDLGTPDGDLSASGQSLTAEASDTSYYTVGAIEKPGDGGPAPLFHLLNGDLCYANLAPGTAPAVWRDFGVNVARSAAHRPWMPALGNHEIELGATARDGSKSTTAFWNGPYGHGHYLSRFVLPDNGVVNYDRNHLQGNFYAFQVGTVYFISLDADDVTYQGNQISETATNTYDSGLTIPAGTVNSSYEYTGTLVAGSNDALVPGGRTPNKQTLWLEEELRRARSDESVDLVVVFMHQCPLSANTAGNGTDLGIRKTWLPLFDEYEVDLVLSGHEHVFERSFPVRGYDHGEYGTVTTAFTEGRNDYAVGDAFNTRRPAVVKNATATVDGKHVVDTSRGTVYYILGGGGALSTYGYTTDPATGIRQANIWSTINGRDAVEDATWSDTVDSGDAHGYAVFDVDPGRRHGETTITVKWFQLPTVAEGAAPAFDPTPYSSVTYGRSEGWGRGPGRRA